MPKIKVRSVSPDGFFRAGRKWMPNGFDLEPVVVSDEQLKMLQDEREVHVQVVDPSAQPESGGDERPVPSYPSSTHARDGANNPGNEAGGRATSGLLLGATVVGASGPTPTEPGPEPTSKGDLKRK